MLLLSKSIFAQENLDYKKINDLYYNMNDYIFNGFSANIEVDILDQLKKTIKDENNLSVLNNIILKLDFFGKDSIDFITNYVKDENNSKFSQGLNQTIDGIGGTVKGA